MKDVIKHIENMHNIDDLKEIESAVLLRLANLKKLQINTARKKIKDMANQLEVDICELMPNTPKINAKYVCPNDPTKKWSGRGKRPTWIVNALKDGAKLEDFAI